MTSVLDLRVVAPPGTPPSGGVTETPGRRWTPGRLWRAALDRARRPWLIGLTASTVATILLAWGLGRPALWLDETASVVATQRSWPDLWHLFGGDETPLLPFYALLKVTSAVLIGPIPALAHDPELLFRLPSVVAAAAAAGLLAGWLAREAGPGPAVAASAVLLSSAGFSRYGQEVRPYAFALLFSVLSTAGWWRLAGAGGRRWIPVYALTVAVLVCTHLLSALLLPAHLLAAVVAVPAGGRRRALLRTAAGILAGLAAVAPFLATAVHAGGATRTPVMTDLNLFLALDHLLSLPAGGQLRLGVVLPLLALLGLVDVVGGPRTPRTPLARLTRLAACWALVPALLFVLAVTQRHNLLLGRYVLFSLPGWSILAGLGLLRLARLAVSALSALLAVSGLSGLSAGRLQVGRTGPWRQNGVTAIALTVLLAAIVVGQVPTLRFVRTAGGHGEDIRPALAAATAPDTRHLALMTNSRFGAIEVSALDPAQERRWIGFSAQRTQQYIWPTRQAPQLRSQELRTHPVIGLLLRLPAAPWCPELYAPPAAAAFVQRCLPTPLSSRHYEVLSTATNGTRWIFAVLARPVP